MDELKKIKYIEYLYSKLTFTEIYGKQIAFVIFITVLEIIAISYFSLFKNARIYKENWNKVRCNWNIIPFAGFINKPDNQTVLEYTQENYNFCTKRSMMESMNSQFEPAFQNQQILNNLISHSNDLIAKTVSSFNGTTDGTNNNVNDASNVIYQIFNLLHLGFILFMDIIHKLSIVLETIVNFGLSGTTWATLFFKMLISAIMTLLIILFIVTVAPTLPFLWAWPPFIIYVLVFIFLLVVSSSFQDTVFIIVNEFSKVEPFTSKINKPKLNLCFGGNTRIKTKDGYTKIKNIKVGDVLKDNSVVTATFKTISVSNIFILDGIVVSGDHYVKYKKWIKVKEHPRSIPYHNKKHLYCLNTTSKKIKINNHTFLDWDDLTPKKMKKMKKINIKDDFGYSDSFLVKMYNGNYMRICDLKPNDILNKNIRVIATVRLDKKYHIVTDKGYFMNDRICMDYNFNIDKLFYLF